MRSAVTELLGIEPPIFAFSHCRDVVAAVSKAGGMGVDRGVGAGDTPDPLGMTPQGTLTALAQSAR